MSYNGTKQQSDRKKYRIWVDGCFDIMHFGHANALRQARETGDTLIVGVHSDEDITKHKGPPIMTLEERVSAVEGCRWVDETVPNAPYTTSIEVMKQYGCDFCVHGNDITTLCDGADCYAEVKKAGLYREVRRTQGVSTTELVGRMLTLNRGHLQHLNSSDDPSSTERFFLSSDTRNNHTIFSRVLPKSQLKKFIPQRLPGRGDVVVYVDGSFDLFHHGHIELLKKVRGFGTYLVAGMYSDKLINSVKGANFPIMNAGERALGLLSCKYVDEVIVNAPASISDELLSAFFPISIVCNCSCKGTLDIELPHSHDPYELPKKLGIYKEVQISPAISITADTIINRVVKNRLRYEEREKRKLQKEYEASHLTALLNS